MLAKKILFGYYDTQCLYTITKLNIAEYLQNGPTSITDLAALVQANENKLYRIMRYMAATGLFDEGANKIFALNSESKYLLANTPGNLKELINIHGDCFYQAAAKFFEGTRTGAIPFEVKFGQLPWDYFNTHHDVGDVFHKAMQELSEFHGKEIAEIYDFSSYKTIVDVGGGLGSLLANILLKYKNLYGINYDLPALKTAAELYFQKKGIASRCQYISGNFFDSVPAAGDLYILKAISHGKEDAAVAVILTHCHAALSNTGRLLIIDRIITKDHNYLDACINDINMLNLSAGGDRTLEEFEKILNETGFSLANIYSIENSLAIIEAVKCI